MGGVSRANDLLSVVLAGSSRGGRDHGRDPTPAEVADAIADAVRTLNYKTGASGAVELEYPSDLYDVLGSLGVAAGRLPQLFGQLAKWLREQQATGQVAHDSGGDVGEYVEAVADALERASTDAVTLGAALDSAHEASSGLKARE
jgi:hypothetical protein